MDLCLVLFRLAACEYVCVIQGMVYLEGRGIVHRDLAARNVLGNYHCLRQIYCVFHLELQRLKCHCSLSLYALFMRCSAKTVPRENN